MKKTYTLTSRTNMLGVRCLQKNNYPKQWLMRRWIELFLRLNNPLLLITIFQSKKLAVPKFGGDPKEYTSFRNMFDKLVCKFNMSTVLMFGYLKSYLVGELLSLIRNLMLTESKYELALSQLTARYSNRRIIAGTIWKNCIKHQKHFLAMEVLSENY